MATPPKRYVRISAAEWRTTWNRRLRPFLVEENARELYREVASHRETRRFGELASVGIGYVSGANNFFHLRPSQAEHLGIPRKLLHATVRNGRALPAKRLTKSAVAKWQRDDEQMLLLRLSKKGSVPASVRRYLDSEAGHIARTAYKCRVRAPWYSVPDVQVPEFFMSYMSGLDVSLVRNDASCTCTNSVHSVRLREGVNGNDLTESWESTLTKLSCELEGHPLGGGMLKLEPREAARIVLSPLNFMAQLQEPVFERALATMREWRHCVPAR